MELDLRVANSGSGFILYSSYIAKFCQDTKSRTGSSSRHLSVLFRSAESSPAQLQELDRAFSPCSTSPALHFPASPFPRASSALPQPRAALSSGDFHNCLFSMLQDPTLALGLKKSAQDIWPRNGQVHRLFPMEYNSPNSWCYPISPTANLFQKPFERAASLAGGDKVI